MSRKGKMSIQLPKGVLVTVSGTQVTVKGPKATHSCPIHPDLQVRIEDDKVFVSAPEGCSSEVNRHHGLGRSLIENLIVGATSGFERQLEMIGVGYRSSVQGNVLDLQIGTSHPTKVAIPKGITVKVDKNTLITISGSDKQQVGQFTAEVRAMKPPEPYQGKGIRYVGEYVRRKAGKAAKTVTTK